MYAVIARSPQRRRWPAGVLVLMVVAVALLASAPGAHAGWQKPQDVLGRPLDNGAFLTECDSPPCGTESGVNGIFRMIGPRSGVGLITLPVLTVVDANREPAPAGAKPSESNDYQYAVTSPLYGVSLSGGRWSVTPFGAGPIYDNWSLPSADIAPDGHGGAIVAYQMSPGRSEGPSVWARHFTGGSWQSATRLAGPFAPGTGRFSHAPRVVVLPSGKALVFYGDWIGPQWSTTVARRWDGNGWGPEGIAETDPVWPDSLSAATGPDGITTLSYARVLLSAGSGQPGQLGARAVDATGFGPRADGELRHIMGPTRTVAGSGGSALVVSTSHDGGLHAQALNGGAFAAPVNVASGYQPGDRFFALSGTPQSADLVWVQGGFPDDNSYFDPARRRVFRASLGAGGWGAPQAIDGGLPSPAPESLDLTEDIAAGGGQVVFTAGKLTVGEGIETNEQRVYGEMLTSAGSTSPELIDNGPGGQVHVVGGDREPGGTGAALFTQLGADGNVRLYGVENVPGGGFKRPSTFGLGLCTDAGSLVAGCATARLDPIRATLVPPKIEADSSAVLSGAVKTARTPAGTAGAARKTVRKAQIAIQRTSGKRCSWWSAPRRRFLRRSCHKPLFFNVKVTGSRWKVRTGRLGKGTATVWVRAASGKRVQRVFRNRTNKRVVRVKRSSRRRG